MSVFGGDCSRPSLSAALCVSATLAGQTGASAPKGETEWRFFGSDIGATRYSPANQINAGNVRDLRVAWRWSARNFGPRPATQMQVSPLIVDGVMYTTAGVNRDVVALDAATGQLLWHWRPTGELTRWFDIIEPVARSSGRGVTYWTDGSGDERIFVVMNSYMLVALDAKTGRQVANFGKNGVVDLAENLRWNERPGLPRDGRVANTSPPAIGWSSRSGRTARSGEAGSSTACTSSLTTSARRRSRLRPGAARSRRVDQHVLRLRGDHAGDRGARMVSRMRNWPARRGRHALAPLQVSAWPEPQTPGSPCRPQVRGRCDLLTDAHGTGAFWRPKRQKRQNRIGP